LHSLYRSSSVTRLPLKLTAAFVALLLSACTWQEVASVNSEGTVGNFDSARPSLSGDGRFVAFHSVSSNLSPADSGGFTSIFVRDLRMGTTEMITLDATGFEANGSSFAPRFSRNGRFVAYRSDATNLVDSSVTFEKNIYLYDRSLRETVIVSANAAGESGNDVSFLGDISDDGRFIVYYTYARNLIPDNTAYFSDVLLFDRDTGSNVLISKTPGGDFANGYSLYPKISGDGRYVVYASDADNLVADDTNGVIDIFLYDTSTGNTSRISVNSEGEEANDHCALVDISEDGQIVAFECRASNLVAGDTDGTSDVFIYDTSNGEITLAGVNSSGEQGNGSDEEPALSSDGRYVAFESYSTNLVSEDTKGYKHIFIHDRHSGRTHLASKSATGEIVDGGGTQPTLSGDGRYVGFSTYSLALSGGPQGFEQVMVASANDVQIDTISPEQIAIGATTEITITGSGFLPGTTPLPGNDGLTFSNIAVTSTFEMTMEVTVDPVTTAGARSVSLALWGTGAGPYTGALTVCPDCLTLF